jgi:DNA-binding transcriptional LysR family regulator
MNLPQLRAFVAVAQTCKVTDAAVDLAVSQSAVSHALASLEAELGLRLIVRDRAGSTLTDAGRALLPHARTALGAVKRLTDEAVALAGLQRGRLRVGAFPTACQLLPPVIRAFRRRFPAVEVVLLEGSDHEVSDWITTGIADLGVVIGPRPDLASVPLTSDEMLAVLPADHPLADQADIAVADLADDPFLLSAGGCEPLIRRIHDEADVPFGPAHSVREMTTLLAMVREGLGISIVPELALRSDSGGLAALPLRPRAPRHLLLAWADVAGPGPAARAFLTCMPTATDTWTGRA